MKKYLDAYEKPFAKQSAADYMNDRMTADDLHASSWTAIGNKEHPLRNRVALLTLLMQFLETWAIALWGTTLAQLTEKVSRGGTAHFQNANASLCTAL